MRQSPPASEKNCSFCGKEEGKVDKLIAGPSPVNICNECVNLCNQVISEDVIKQPKFDAQTRHRGLKSEYQFDNFVTSKGNNLALAVARSVADLSETTHSPLFIYGEVGVGKTHVLQAVGNSFKDKHSEAKIGYIHSLNFISELVRAFQSKQLDLFKQHFTSLDLLLIDDIQFISDKSGTQRELYFVIDSLLNSDKRIVIACDSPPNEIRGILQPKIKSLCEGGVVFKLTCPDFDSRIVILRQKFAALGCSIEDGVYDYIAQHFSSNIRELEGAVNHIHAHSKLLSSPVTVVSVNKLFPHILSQKSA